MNNIMFLKANGLMENYDVGKQGEQPLIELVEKEGIIELNFIFPAFQISDVEKDVLCPRRTGHDPGA